MKEISHFPITLPLDRIRRRLKVPLSGDFSRYRELIDRFFVLVEPSCRYDDRDVTVGDRKIVMKDGFEINSKSLGDHLRGCCRVTMIAVTIGDHVEEKITHFGNQNKMLESMILDAMGSECVEEAAIYLSGLIGNEVRKRGLIPTKRFSPGYGDLKLDVQRYFFDQLKLVDMGLRLNDSLLMLPQKSITAFIGWKTAS
jgi:hypothetical protein